MNKLRAIFEKNRLRAGDFRGLHKNPDENSPFHVAKGQAFIEMALILPILIMFVLGVVELSLFIGRYLDMLDLTREAARFASVRDPFELYSGDLDCSDQNNFNFYFHTSCIFSPPKNSPSCSPPSWCPVDGGGNLTNCFCEGLNPYLVFDPEWDDVVISVYTVANTQDPATGDIVSQVTNTWPTPKNYWALSNPYGTGDPDDENWKKDCQGAVDLAKTPHFTADVINNLLQESSPPNKGFVAVEFYYCYDQTLDNPIFSEIIPNPLRLNAYTLMPLPEAAPTPTPLAP